MERTAASDFRTARAVREVGSLIAYAVGGGGVEEREGWRCLVGVSGGVGASAAWSAGDGSAELDSEADVEEAGMAGMGRAR